MFWAINCRLWGLGLLVTVIFAGSLHAEEPKETRGKKNAVSEAEARERAKILHDFVHHTLQMVHRDFFDPLEKDMIPSETMSEVFEEIEKDWGIEIRWLGVEGKTMNVDHKPKDQFEREAVEKLAAGKKEFESVGEMKFRRAAPIVLHNACLKCHVPNRKSLEDRVAGLVISMPLIKKK